MLSSLKELLGMAVVPREKEKEEERIRLEEVSEKELEDQGKKEVEKPPTLCSRIHNIQE